jgi:hypothetical protein
MNKILAITPSESISDRKYATLIASNVLRLSEDNQEKKLILAKLGDWEPISFLSDTKKEYCMLASSSMIERLLHDRPTGEWRLFPLPASTDKQVKVGDFFHHILSTSSISQHLSSTNYVMLSNEITDSISSNWELSPQIRFVTSQLFAGAILVQNSKALLLNCVEVYIRFKSADAHYERRLEASIYQS